MYWKLLLTGVVVFIKPGSTTQMWYVVFVALISVLLMTAYTPYVNETIDVVSWVAQTCTLLTMLCALALKVGCDDDAFETFVQIVLVTAQLVPLFAIGYVIFTGLREFRKAHRVVRQKIAAEQEQARQQDVPLKEGTRRDARRFEGSDEPQKPEDDAVLGV